MRLAYIGVDNVPSDYLPHPLAERLPLMSDAAFADLKHDIKANGLKQSVVLFENMVLDGRHRLRACNELGIAPTFVTFRGTTAKAEAHILSLNVHRRHLTRDEQRRMIHAELKRDPSQSDRSIAKTAYVSDKTVAVVRANAEASAEIPQHQLRQPKYVDRFESQYVKVRAELLCDPTRSNRAIALKLHSSPRVVKKQRAQLEAAGSIQPRPAHTAKSFDDRVVEITALVNTGHNIQQIASLTHISEERVRLLIQKSGIKAPAIIGSRSRPVNCRRVIEESVNSLTGIAAGLKTISWRSEVNDLQLPHVREMISETKEALRSINWLLTTLKRLPHDY